MDGRPAHRVACRLQRLLAARGMSWDELARRSGFPARTLRRLCAPEANPRLRVADRVAGALDLTVEEIWRLARNGAPTR